MAIRRNDQRAAFGDHDRIVLAEQDLDRYDGKIEALGDEMRRRLGAQDRVLSRIQWSVIGLLISTISMLLGVVVAVAGGG